MTFDRPTRALASLAVSLKFEDLTRAAVEATKRHLIDTIGCALGAIDAKPATIARRLCPAVTGDTAASVFGLAYRTTPEHAAFANTCMVRYLDFNDTGIGGHPSDMIAAVFALAEPRRASGRTAIAAINAAYEAFAGLRYGGFSPRRCNIDQIQCAIGAAVGAASMHGLNEEQAANAVSLALTPSVPLRVTRSGALSQWKGCATAHGAMTAVLAARWAGEGLTGPPRPFEGAGGLCELLHIDPPDLDRIGAPVEGLSAIEATGLKAFPAEYSAQGPIALAMKLREKCRLDDIEQIEVALHWSGYDEIGGGQGDHDEKWNPTTREAADHSLPCLVAVALLDGTVSVESFAEARLRDPRLQRLMQRITASADAELTRQHAGALPSWPSAVEIVLKNGERLREQTRFPKGHPRNPLDDEELAAKFFALSDAVITRAQAQQLVDTLWSLDSLPAIAALTDPLRTAGPGRR
jgi:2-methylcitrate dehydratase